MEGVPDIKQEEIFIDEDDPNVVLGEGAFGIVYRGKCRGLNVAIKMPKAFDISGPELEQFKDEVRMMAKLYHPRIALFLGACIEGDDISVVTELLDGDVEQLVLRSRGLSLFQRMLWARQAASGMAWVHGADVVHRDLKPSNLLYSRAENAVKVCDFGFTILVKDRAKAQQMTGSPFYLAPEVLEGKGASFKSDVYAFGIIMHFLITGERVPFKGATEWAVEDVFKHVLEGQRPELPAKKMQCPSSLRALCERCWAQDPKERPTFEQIIDEMNKNVLIDSAVFSGKGRKFWKVCFAQDGNLREEVPWQEFVDNFAKYFAEGGLPLRTGDAAYKCMRSVFLENSAGNDIVSLRNFGRMLGFFMPLEKGEWLRQLLLVFREPWFWGDTSREVACQKLAPEPRGTFLVRYASEDSYFTISYVALNQHNKKEIFHTRVVHNYASNQFLIPTTRSGSRTCSSLQEVVFALQEGSSNIVSRACPGSPFLSFFQENSLDHGYGFVGGYQAADVQPDYMDDEDPMDESGGGLQEASVGNLKESQQVFPPHLISGNNNSNNGPPKK